MPPKKKQTPRNAYYYFMMEFKGRQGRNFKSMQEVATAAAPHWAKMSKDQRRPYEERALMEKNHMRAAKYTSEGLDVEELEMEERREQMRIQEMRQKINDNLKMASVRGLIQEEMFFIIHINTFCYCEREERHIPAEIAIAAFNLEDGVMDVFHRIIKPGPMPMGYASAAMSHSKETHQIQPPMIGDNEHNVEEVYFEMKNFLSNKLRGSKRLPPLYTEEKLSAMTQHVLDSWCHEYGEPRPLYEVYNLQYMFRILRNTVAKDEIWPTDTYSIREIEKDVYAYAKGIACEFHEVTNVPLYCSKSTAIRQCYVICDNCCVDLSIPLRPGFHVPETAYIKSSRAGSVVSLASSQRSSALKPTTRDDDTDSVMSFSSKSSWDNESVYSNNSSSFTISSEDSFPELGQKKKQQHPFSMNAWRNFSPKASSSVTSNEESLSYATAMGSAGTSKRTPEVPASLIDDIDNLSIEGSATSDDEHPYSTFVKARGKGRPFNASPRGFPPLGRGRGFPSFGRGRRLVDSEDD